MATKTIRDLKDCPRFTTSTVKDKTGMPVVLCYVCSCAKRRGAVCAMIEEQKKLDRCLTRDSFSGRNRGY